jgi:peptidoglycan/xylan/chitin deacetylase (PgdA/CDA1 family)
MLLIYTTQSTPRLKYILKLIFENILVSEYKLTCDLEEFKKHAGCRINYSKSAIEADDIHIIPVNLLFESNIHQQDVRVTDWQNIKIFFQNESSGASLPFDPFAASFYLVSRYEEYLPHIRDKHNRYKPEESLAFQNGFLKRPIINIWMQLLQNIITQKYPDFQVLNKDYCFVLTFDIDIAYAHKYKGTLRSFLSFVKLMVNFKFREIIKQARTMLGMVKDPYDNYDYMIEIQQKYKVPMAFFFLLGDFNEFDKNLSHLNTRFQSLINKINDYADVGIHASYASNKKPELLHKEIERLKNIIHKDVTKNRQHFLILNLPYTYRVLSEAGLTDDYTMGYASEPGFRAGICTPFLFYNLNLEYETNITVHPIAFMEGTFAEYKKMKTFEAQAIINDLIDEVKKVNGVFLCLWHNHSLSEEGSWKGWRKVFEDTVKYGV